ncbi:DUF2690 domain-containing protein [Kitasatospora sp. NPDC002227]|uniref:DUF2690 domain-containing protein n=1 Tax=Kitasatospora sp. NPDC002227 TaxID=3154773 RepID=UPI00332A505A
MPAAPRPAVWATALLLACGGLAALPAAEAQAAGRCTGSGCTGKDPQTVGCGGDALTTASFSGAAVRVELRHSPACQASWARASSAPVGQILYVENTRGVRRQITVRSGQATVWTPMADATVATRACLGVADSDAVTCTSWQ